AAAAAFAPLPPGLVERAYSTSAFLRLQQLVTSASNLAPFALFDALIVATIAAWVIAVGVDVARRLDALRVAGRLAWRTLVWVAVLYLLFLVAWGLNYRRVRLADKLQFDASAVSPDALRL